MVELPAVDVPLAYVMRESFLTRGSLEIIWTLIAYHYQESRLEDDTVFHGTRKTH